MPEVTLRKQLKIVELYFGGVPYDDITRRVGVGKGSVVKVINDLKDGQYPEFIEVVGEVEVLREVAVRLNREGITPGRVALGFAAWEGLTSAGISPEEAPKAVALLRTLTPADSDQRQFAQAALYLWDLKERTGRDPAGLQKWVQELEDRGKEAEAVVPEIDALEVERSRLLEQKTSLDKEIKAQGERLNTLSAAADPLREQVNSGRAALKALNESHRKNERAWMEAEEKLNRANEALNKIRALGLAPEDWVPAEQMLQQIGKRYRLEPENFKKAS